MKGALDYSVIDSIFSITALVAGNCPVSRFEYTFVPLTVTSNTPPDPGISENSVIFPRK